jgi:hypothetical protein
MLGREKNNSRKGESGMDKSTAMKISNKINKSESGYYGLYAKYRHENGSGWYVKISDGWGQEIVSVFEIKELDIFLRGMAYIETTPEYISKCSYSNLMDRR